MGHAIREAGSGPCGCSEAKVTSSLMVCGECSGVTILERFEQGLKYLGFRNVAITG